MPIQYRIYQVDHTTRDGSVKSYVGLTVRTLDARLRSHIAEKARNKGVAKGSLGEAIRLAFAADPDCKAFSIRQLEECASVEDMCRAEAHWIAKLDTRAPQGYNLMPGGASVGGPSNAVPFKVTVNGVEQVFASRAEACRVFCGAMREDLFYARVRGRLNAGWSNEQALGLERRTDGRATDLSIRARSEGKNLATLRSQRQRERDRVTVPAPAGYAIPVPGDPGATIDVRSFAAQTGIAANTIRHRFRRALAESIEDPAQFVAFLRNPDVRGIGYSVVLADNTVLEAKSRRALATCAAKGAHPAGTLSVNGIRRRLGALPPDADNDQLRIAIGHAPAPPRATLSTAAPVMRKVHCSDWTVVGQGGSHGYPNQMAFCRACYSALLNLPAAPSKLSTLDLDDPAKGLGQLQRWVSARTAQQIAPTEIARMLGVLEVVASGPVKASPG